MEESYYLIANVVYMWRNPFFLYLRGLFENFVFVAYDIKAKKIFQYNKFDYKGPDLEIRSARHFTSCGVSNLKVLLIEQNTITNQFVLQNICIYDPKKSILTIGPFDLDQIDYEYLLSQSDNFLLRVIFFLTRPNEKRVLIGKIFI